MNTIAFPYYHPGNGTVLVTHDERDSLADCSVVAVSVATLTPYVEVHEIMAHYGRKKNRRTPWDITRKTVKRLGFRFDPWSVDGKTVRTVERELPDTGAFIIRINAHLFCRREGITYDSYAKKRSRVWMVRRIVER